jgi:hypothetical protein
MISDCLERGNYWTTKARQDASFNAQLQDFERQRAANTERNTERQQRYNELLADENYKAQNCRLCPHCQRPVQHLGGSDAMICGQNYHGGDQQSGCGKNFNWSQATPYQPIGNGGHAQVRLDVQAPARAQTTVHEGVQWVIWSLVSKVYRRVSSRCDACRNNVQGICFVCIHCPSLIFCEKCEQRQTLEHANQIRQEGKQQHVFQLITRPDGTA